MNSTKWLKFILNTFAMLVAPYAVSWVLRRPVSGAEPYYAFMAMYWIYRAAKAESVEKW